MRATAIEPSDIQVAPQETGGSSATRVGSPPESATFFSSLIVVKPSHSPSGEKNAASPPSVPGIGSASPPARRFRTKPRKPFSPPVRNDDRDVRLEAEPELERHLAAEDGSHRLARGCVSAASDESEAGEDEERSGEEARESPEKRSAKPSGRSRPRDRPAPGPRSPPPGSPRSPAARRRCREGAAPGPSADSAGAGRRGAATCSPRAPTSPALPSGRPPSCRRSSGPLNALCPVRHS